MAAHPEVDECLRHVRTATDRLLADLDALSPEAWDGPSSCVPWTIRQLVAHIIISGQGFVNSVERGAAGQTEPPAPEAGREGQIAALAASDPAELRARVAQVTDDTERLYERLTPEQLEAICFHRRGNRPARWYVQHRLAELAFHHWDLERSLDREPRLDPAVAAFLLPMLIESNVPRVYLVGPRGEGRFRLTVSDDPLQSWLLTASPDRLDVQRGANGADVTITASPVTLALLLYGRANLPDEERAGRARTEGDRAVANRFHEIFKGP